MHRETIHFFEIIHHHHDKPDPSSRDTGYSSSRSHVKADQPTLATHPDICQTTNTKLDMARYDTSLIEKFVVGNIEDLFHKSNMSKGK